MNQSADARAAEMRAIQVRMEELRRELDTLEARLTAVAHGGAAPPPPRQLHMAFRLGPATHEPPLSVSVAGSPGAARKPPTHPQDRLAQSARGTFFFAPAGGEGTGRPVALWLRTTSRQIAALGTAPDVEFRAAILSGHEWGAVVVVALVRLGPEEPENIYEALLDASDEETRGELEALAGQETLDLRLHGDDGQLERTLHVPNALRPLAAEAARMSSAMRPGSPDPFHAARAAVYQQYPTPRALWRAFKA
ncbi:MAG: hypothetical protein IT429_21400 [Gemmataceae bacterium]|nr:hypothetical protein [Gemmataceae bacterium]